MKTDKRKEEKAMNEQQLKVKNADLDVAEQDIMIEIAKTREILAALETKRERVRLERTIAYAGYVNEPW